MRKPFEKMTTVELYTYYINEMTESDVMPLIAEINKRDVTRAEEKELIRLGVI